MNVSAQCGKILDYMTNYGEISQRDAYKLGIYRLSARIFDLKTYGHKIIKRTETVENKDGSRSRVAFYRLSEYEEQKKAAEKRKGQKAHKSEGSQMTFDDLGV